ncbi:MAG TPA: hypothetical protein ENI17_11430 [Pseudomonas xinjiangensis]|uniref:ZIP Zinc transporter n=2 Tax=root TaxID=1 RepID=A0A7V1BQ30_9GAMM|nr:hypothetical protein [Halopseudomonas xinjiangensis]HEC48224.1 hypothetical protein [Halopseudomonas xinjiangensis]
MLATFVAAAVLILVHFFSGKLKFLNSKPRSRWLSLAGGVSVSYVFIHLLPEIARGQRIVDNQDSEILSYLEHHAYLLALSGLIVFYGLERMVRQHRRRLPEEAQTHGGVFWLHIVSFALYNILIGYLLTHREADGPASLLWFTVAMALHFLVNDFSLEQDHLKQFDRQGRWVLAAALLVGWWLGVTWEISELAISAWTAILAGSVILTVMKEELPEERESRFSAFLIGAFGYALVLLAA